MTVDFHEKACGVCGKPAERFFVHGYRCLEHHEQTKPSDAIMGKDMIIVVPGLSKKTDEPFMAAEIIVVTK